MEDEWALRASWKDGGRHHRLSTTTSTEFGSRADLGSTSFLARRERNVQTQGSLKYPAPPFEGPISGRGPLITAHALFQLRSFF